MTRRNSQIISFSTMTDIDLSPDFDEFFTKNPKETSSCQDESFFRKSTNLKIISSLPREAPLHIEKQSQTIDQIEPLSPFDCSVSKKKFSKQTKSSKKSNAMRVFICSKKLKKMRISQKTPKSLNPKKEYFRVKLLRGFKRIIRHVFEKQGYPMTTLNKYNASQFRAYEELKAFVLANSSKLLSVSQTHNGPLTDGVSHNKKKFGEDYKKKILKDKTFNNGFCYNFLKDETVKRCYCLYIDYLFENQDASMLKNKFELQCCLNKLCKCSKEKWGLLEEYTKGKLMEAPGRVSEEDVEASCFESEYFEDDF